MKLLVFAHTPPPHHGQSYMVKLMLDGFGGDARRREKSEVRSPQSAIECYHVNCRYSDDLEDIGSFRLEKMWLVLRYCLEAIWCRFRHGVRAFYYVPAPGKRAALYRDWIVMLLCRPFFPRFIHHWHAVGLGDWLKREGSWPERWLTHRLLGRPTLGLALAIPSMRDALWFRSRQVEIVPNGIPDPCPDFDAAVLPRRRARYAERNQLLARAASPAGVDPVFRVLFLAHCTREKGVFDTLEAVLAANETLRANGSPVRLHLEIAGGFLDDAEKDELQQRLADEKVAAQAHYAGFVSGETKTTLLRDSDALCFPTYYSAEGQPVNLIESLAFGLPIITTEWRTIPELPGDLAIFVRPQKPLEIAAALLRLAAREEPDFAAMRARFLAHFVASRHMEALRHALERAA
jgi:glycosyltransferase involved in cell wall biosynthesis